MMKYVFTFVIFSVYVLYSQGRYWELCDAMDNANFTMLNCVCIDDSYCIASYDYKSWGIILRLTTDGGNSWKSIYQDTIINNKDTFYFSGKYSHNTNIFPHKDLIILHNDQGLIAKSHDLGQTWIYTRLDTAKDNRIEMFDNKHGIRIEYPLNRLNFKLYYTDDAAESWSDIEVPWGNRFDIIRGFEIIEPGKLLLQLTNEDYGAISLWYYDNYSRWEIKDAIKDINYVSPNTAFQILRPNDSYQLNINKSSNDGDTWNSVLDTIFDFKSKVLLGNENNLLIYDSQGRNILRTSNGGTSWFDDKIKNIEEIPNLNKLLIAGGSYGSKNAILLYSYSGYIFRLTNEATNISELHYESKNNNVFPNPCNCSGELTLLLNNDIAIEYNLDIYDVHAGIVISNIVINSDENIKPTLSLADYKLVPGVYFIKVSDRYTSSIYKFVCY